MFEASSKQPKNECSFHTTVTRADCMKPVVTKFFHKCLALT